MADTSRNAFPVVAANGLGHVSEGMTLRQYYAGQVIIGLLANYGHSTEALFAMPYEMAKQHAGHLALAALVVVDAMLEMENKQND